MTTDRQEAKKIIKLLMKKHNFSAQDVKELTGIDSSEAESPKMTGGKKPTAQRRPESVQTNRRRSRRPSKGSFSRKPGISDVGVTNTTPATEGSNISQGAPITRSPVVAGNLRRMTQGSPISGKSPLRNIRPLTETQIFERRKRR